MKNLIIYVFLIATVKVAVAQDTAFVSSRLTTALFFKFPVHILGPSMRDINVVQKEDALITLKASRPVPNQILTVRENSSAKIYNILISYSYDKAGRAIRFGQKPQKNDVIAPGDNGYNIISKELQTGTRKDVADHKKVGGVKAWVDKMSLAGSKLFFRLDLRNKSKLPYEIDFVRFYIRDLKSVERMATHEQEIVPVYTTLKKRTLLVHKEEIARVFAFKRFSLSDDQALNIELYEKNGNRHIYMQIKQSDLDNIKIQTAYPAAPGKKPGRC